MEERPNDRYLSFYPTAGYSLGPVPVGAVALAFHYSMNGDPDPGWAYVVEPVPDVPLVPVIGYWVRMVYLLATYRMVVNYEYKSPPLNSAVTTHDWEWIGGGDTPADAYESVEAKYDAYFTAIKSVFATSVRLTGYRWSKWKNDWSKPEPSHRFASRDVQINSTSGDEFAPLPPQIAIAVTEETEFRRRWGRFYLPFIARGTGGDRIKQSTCDLLATSTKTLLEDVPGLWRHVTVSSKDPRLLATKAVRVDDVYDVIRTRRYGQANYRKRLMMD